MESIETLLVMIFGKVKKDNIIIKRRPQTAGLTLVEVIIAISIAGLVIAGGVSGIIYFYRMSVMSAYESGAVRVLQTHVERINNLQISQITNTHIVNYNYSGLRLTTTSSETNQVGLTNTISRNYIFSTLPTNSIMTVNQTNATEDAVMAYLTTITISDRYITNTYLGQVNSNRYKQIDIRTFWHALGRNRTNEVTLLKYK